MQFDCRNSIAKGSPVDGVTQPTNSPTPILCKHCSLGVSELQQKVSLENAVDRILQVYAILRGFVYDLGLG
jgi:hypothetical protein